MWGVKSPFFHKHKGFTNLKTGFRQEQLSALKFTVSLIKCDPDKMEPDFWSLLRHFLQRCDAHCSQTSKYNNTHVTVFFLHASTTCDVRQPISSIIRSWYKHAACLLAHWCWWDLLLRCGSLVPHDKAFFDTHYYRSDSVGAIMVPKFSTQPQSG